VSLRIHKVLKLLLMPQHQNYSDTILVSAESGTLRSKLTESLQHVHQNVYRLHAIILSRSPFFAHLMSTSPQAGAQRVIYVHLDQEPEITQEVRVPLLPLWPWFVTRCFIGFCHRYQIFPVSVFELHLFMYTFSQLWDISTHPFLLI
jgi:hypothetical protein